MDDALKTRARDIKSSNAETMLLFAPPIEISGHVPDANHLCICQIMAVSIPSALTK